MSCAPCFESVFAAFAISATFAATLPNVSSGEHAATRTKPWALSEGEGFHVGSVSDNASIQSKQGRAHARCAPPIWSSPLDEAQELGRHAGACAIDRKEQSASSWHERPRLHAQALRRSLSSARACRTLSPQVPPASAKSAFNSVSSVSSSGFAFQLSAITSSSRHSPP